jgi:hypothetical protein
MMESLNASARRLACWHSVSDIELHGCPVVIDGQRWYDTRPMVDPREHSPECIDMGQEAINYALGHKLVQPHPDMPHLVRISSACSCNHHHEGAHHAVD